MKKIPHPVHIILALAGILAGAHVTLGNEVRTPRDVSNPTAPALGMAEYPAGFDGHRL